MVNVERERNENFTFRHTNHHLDIYVKEILIKKFFFHFMYKRKGIEELTVTYKSNIKIHTFHFYFERERHRDSL